MSTKLIKTIKIKSKVLCAQIKERKRQKQIRESGLAIRRV